MLRGDGRPIRLLRARLADGQPVTLALPAGAERVRLASTRAAPRVRVTLAQRRPSRIQVKRTRPKWADDSDIAMWWRWLRATRRASRSR